MLGAGASPGLLACRLATNVRRQNQGGRAEVAAASKRCRFWDLLLLL